MALRTQFTRLAALAVAAAACSDVVPTSAPPSVSADAAAVACGIRANNTIDKLTQCVTLDAVRAHLAEFQLAADANGGHRLPGTPGYDASADYLTTQLENAGYVVTRQPINFEGYIVEAAELQQIAPFAATYGAADFGVLTRSPAGNVTAAVTAVDIMLPPGSSSSTSGCEAADFAGFPAGNIALIQRGTCFFEQKAVNAQAAGAVAVIIFNEGNTPDRQGVVTGTLATPTGATIPVLGATFQRGVEWATTPGLTMRILVDVLSSNLTTSNVIAELRGTQPTMIIAGAALGSLAGSPGINANASGAAALLETAVQMARVRPRNTVRFAWWAAGAPNGAAQHVAAMSADEIAATALYLNFDVIASPNYVRFVYDGDGSSSGVPGPDGSGAIESTIAGFYGARGLAVEPQSLGLLTDHLPFAGAGIPVGGIYSGTIGIKSAAEAVVYGGVTGVAYDPCYGLACDTFANVNNALLDLNADIVASSVVTFGMSVASVNGPPGNGNSSSQALSAGATPNR